MSDFLFVNGRILTFDPKRPRASAMGVREGRIVAVGDEHDVARAIGPQAEVIDCHDGTLLPAFIDAHCHLLSYAASLRSVDCTGARSVSEIQDAIRRRAAETPAGRWIRAFGHEETSLVERRHPDRHDLDAAASAHPVRLIHRAGHASVLNTLALRQADIAIDTEEPPGGVIERELASGEPNGVLLGMERFVDSASPPLPYEELRAAVREAADRMLAAGIACIQDATHTNGPSEWALFERLMADGVLPLDVILMEGSEHLGTLPVHGADVRLRRGAVKIMLHEIGDEVTPGEGELARLVHEAHTAGRQVAVHAIGERAVAAAAAAIESAIQRSPRADHRHRIEHCGVLPGGIAPRLAGLGVLVVSQPSFVHERGERYLQLVPEEQRQRLYAFRTLTAAGVSLASGSDAPVSQPLPLGAVAAAVDRLSASGRPVAPREAVDAEDALSWWTANAAFAAFLERERGSVRPGLRADFALFAAEVIAAPPSDLRSMAPQGLWVAGRQIR